MKPILYYSTNNREERVTFETALLNGMASRFGLYMVARNDIPRISTRIIADMRNMSYGEVAFHVLYPFLQEEIPEKTLKDLLNDAYNEEVIPTSVDHVVGGTHIIWLTRGPTYSFKDYAARFFGRALNYFLSKRGIRKVVIVATSGDTGGAVADALYGLSAIDNIVFYPKGLVSDGQRRQMTTLKKNIYAFEIKGDFDVCQALAKHILGDKAFAKEIFNDRERFTSANSISIGRLIPQAVYPFFAYAKMKKWGESFIVSIPSGNFGNMMGTVIAKHMGLPVSTIICGVNENTEFPEFLETGIYTVRPSIKSPSSAMIVSHPSNLARLIDFYGGHMYDERDPVTGNIIKPGIIDRMPDMDEMRKDLFSIGVTNQEHYDTIRFVYEKYGIILDPHGAVGWKSLEVFLKGKHDMPAVVYETADPGKFPEDVEKAIGIVPELPPNMKRQAAMEERIYSIESEPDKRTEGYVLSKEQVEETKEKIKDIFKGSLK